MSPGDAIPVPGAYSDGSLGNPGAATAQEGDSVDRIIVEEFKEMHLSDSMQADKTTLDAIYDKIRDGGTRVKALTDRITEEVIEPLNQIRHGIQDDDPRLGNEVDERLQDPLRVVLNATERMGSAANSVRTYTDEHQQAIGNRLSNSAATTMKIENSIDSSMLLPLLRTAAIGPRLITRVITDNREAEQRIAQEISNCRDATADNGPLQNGLEHLRQQLTKLVTDNHHDGRLGDSGIQLRNIVDQVIPDIQRAIREVNGRPVFHGAAADNRTELRSDMPLGDAMEILRTKYLQIVGEIENLQLRSQVPKP